MKPLVLALSVVALASVAAACGGSDGAKSAGPVPSVPIEAEPPATSPDGSEQLATADCPTSYELWFVRDAGTVTGEDGTEVALGPRLFPVSRTGEQLATMASAAGIPARNIDYALCPAYNGLEWILHEALRAGLSPDEVDAGVTSAIPIDAQVPSINYGASGGGVILSSEFASGASSLDMRLRLAQWVFTMGQPLFGGDGHHFAFSIDGQPLDVLSADGTVLDRPVTREDFEDLLPPITVMAPTIGSEVASPVRISGTAEPMKNMKARVLDAAGNVLGETDVHGRSSYEIQIPFDVSEAQPGVIQLQGDWLGTGVANPSVAFVEIPVTLVPVGVGTESGEWLSGWRLTRAEYSAQADAICKAATSSFSAAVAGLPEGLEAVAAGAELAEPSESLAMWHEAAVSFSEEALAKLRVLPPPLADFGVVGEFYSLVERQIDVLRRAAGAASAPHLARVIEQRVALTQQLDAFEWFPPGCPVALPG